MPTTLLVLNPNHFYKREPSRMALRRFSIQRDILATWEINHDDLYPMTVDRGSFYLPSIETLLKRHCKDFRLFGKYYKEACSLLYNANAYDSVPKEVWKPHRPEENHPLEVAGRVGNPVYQENRFPRRNYGWQKVVETRGETLKCHDGSKWVVYRYHRDLDRKLTAAEVGPGSEVVIRFLGQDVAATGHPFLYEVAVL